MTTSKLYDNPQAGLNCFMLMEELSNAVNAPAGYVELHKTTRGTKSTDTREYPPVYTVWFIPNCWESITADVLDVLTKIAEKHEAKMDVTARPSTRYTTAHVAMRFKHA